LFLLSFALSAQTTPQWSIPLYFEDANGHLDTIYIGYDPTADELNAFDSEFEEYLWIDTTKFNVVMNRFGTYSPETGQYNGDSAKIIEISSSITFGAFINFVKGEMPIKMTWDMDLFYNTDLPFPDISPLPIGVAFIYCGAGEPGYVNCPSAFDDDPLVMTDQTNINYSYPIESPHIFDGSGEPPYNEPEVALGGQFQLVFTAYNTHTEIVEITNGINIVIAPNPCQNFLNIHSQIAYERIELFNAVGNLIYESNSSGYDHIINTSAISSGVYFLYILIDGKAIYSSFYKN